MKVAFDLVIYGSTGFTGELIVQELSRRHQSRGGKSPLKIALAGRNQGKLEAQLRAAPAGTFAGVVVAAANDRVQIDAMVRSCRCVLAVAGPYASLGEPIVRACAEFGVHYVDLTGEAYFVKHMTEKYQKAAKASGAMLVFASGMDSVPSDLTGWFTLAALPAEEFSDKLDQRVSLTVCTEAGLNRDGSVPLIPKGALSTGTLRTLLEEARSGHLGAYLEPPEGNPGDDEFVRQVCAHPTRVVHEPELGLTLVASEVLPDAFVLRRSVMLGRRGDPKLHPRICNVSFGYAVPNKLAGYIVLGLLALLKFLRYVPLVLPMLLRIARPGIGPTPAMRATSAARVSGAARVESTGTVVTTRAFIPMDPYDFTVIACLAVAEALIEHRGGDGCGGSLTPVTAVGYKELKRALESQGAIKLEVVRRVVVG